MTTALFLAPILNDVNWGFWGAIVVVGILIALFIKDEMDGTGPKFR